MRRKSMKKRSIKEKVKILPTIFLCVIACIVLYHISDFFVKLPDYGGFDEETLADMILIEKSYDDRIGFVIYGDGRIYSFYKDEGAYFVNFSQDYEYTKESVEKHGTLEVIRVSKRDIRRILRYIPNIDPENDEKGYGGVLPIVPLCTKIFDHINQRGSTLVNDGGFFYLTNTSPNADALIKLVDKYDRMMYCLYKIKGEDPDPYFRFWGRLDYNRAINKAITKVLGIKYKYRRSKTMLRI